MPSKPWQLAAWRKRRVEFVKDKVCEWCGSTKFLTIHHPKEIANGKASLEKYESFEGTIILCRRCHLATHKGYHLCPDCKTNYAQNGYEICYKCYSKSIPDVSKYILPCGDIQIPDHELGGFDTGCHDGCNRGLDIYSCRLHDWWCDGDDNRTSKERDKYFREHPEMDKTPNIKENSNARVTDVGKKL